MHLAAKKICNTFTIKICNTFTIKIYNTFTNKIYNTFTNIHSSTTIFNYSDFNNIYSEILEPTNQFNFVSSLFFML